MDGRELPRARALLISDIPLIASQLSELAARTCGSKPFLASSWAQGREAMETNHFEVVIVCVSGTVTRPLLSLDRLHRPDRWLILPMNSSASLAAHAQENRRISLLALNSEQEAIAAAIANAAGHTERRDKVDHAPKPTRTALTRNEHALLTLLCEGLSSRQIAARLNVTAGTTRNTLSRIYQKLGVENRTAAALTYRALFPNH